jgi:hypothetical protein
MVGAPDPPQRHEVKNGRGKKPEAKREGASVVSGSAAFRSAGRQAILLWNFVKMYGHGYAHLVNVWHRV